MSLTEDAASPKQGVGLMIRDWRSRRRYSQMNLALDVGVSPRHLSFIETGRARPSAVMLEALAQCLDVPLREHNRMLLAAGYAPRYSERLLDDPAMAKVRQSLERLLRAHEPYPGLVLDRQWNVVLANRPALALTAVLPAFLTEPKLNIFRASLHPQGLASVTENFSDWAGYLLDCLRRAVALSGDADLAELEKELLGYPNVAAVQTRLAGESPADDGFLVPCILKLPAGRMSMFTTVTTFGTPRDITLDELSVELFYPADDSTEAMLRSQSMGSGDR